MISKTNAEVLTTTRGKINDEASCSQKHTKVNGREGSENDGREGRAQPTNTQGKERSHEKTTGRAYLQNVLGRGRRTRRRLDFPL